MSASFATLQPWLAPYARYMVAATGAQLTSTRRSHVEQQQLYDSCGHGQCRYPALPPSQSMHVQGRAWDMVASRAMLYRAGMFWRSLGGRWGPDDPIHFEA